MKPAQRKILIYFLLCFLPVFLVITLSRSSLVSSQEPTVISPTELFISEYIEGSSNNKALEVYNPGDSPVDLAANNYQIAFYFNGNSSPTTTISLSGTLTASDVFVIADVDADPAILNVADQTSSSIFFNGDDAVVLKKDGSIIDVLGQIGFDPGSEWGNESTSTADNTLVRKCEITTGDTNGDDLFDPSVEWEGDLIDTFSHLGSHSFCPPTPTPTSSPLPTPTETSVPLPTPTETSVPLTPIPTETSTPEPTQTEMPTITPEPTQTQSPIPTLSPKPYPIFPRPPFRHFFQKNFKRFLSRLFYLLPFTQ